MIQKKVLRADRIRKIDGGFSFVPHRFLTDGFLSALSQKELLLYFFLVLVSDRNGLSFYSYDVICSLLEVSVDEYVEGRDGLIQKDLIAFDGTLFQVLNLPQQPKKTRPVGEERRRQVQNLIQRSLWEVQGGA
ncbi:MAG: helix-turn-helix domain-containing protein [Pseudomonadota bacterium]